MEPLRIEVGNLRYQAMIGTGGIGTGVFFELAQNHTLGREESRSGRFLDQRDYCKLHIITHYVQTLLGPNFITLPLGRVGVDEAGRRLMQEMKEAGIDIRYVEMGDRAQTLFSFCFLYPDGSGGNLTVDDSATNRVDAKFVYQAEEEFQKYQGHGIALAAPEAPLTAREAILSLGTQYQFLRVAAFNSAEIGVALERGLLTKTDFLAINLDEAAAAVGIQAESCPAGEIVQAAVEVFQHANPQMQISITAGKQGSWTWDGNTCQHVPAFLVQAANTAGAGDAYLAGSICGLAAGLLLIDAQVLGALTAALSVTSPHTIHPGIDRRTLAELAALQQYTFPQNVLHLLR